MLARLERLARRYGGDAAAGKAALVRTLSRARLRTPAQVLRLHEVLLFLRAFPDDAGVLDAVESALRSFRRRPDVAAHAAALADSGIAGTPIRYRFFWPTAPWLDARWPARLEFDWDEDEGLEDRLATVLPQVLPWIQAEAFRRSGAPVREKLDRLRARSTAASFVLGRIGRFPGGASAQEAVHVALDAPFVLAPGPGGPSRTTARWEGAPAVFRSAPPDRSRPDLAADLTRAPVSVRDARPAEARRLIDLAREAMVTRSRDLDAFAWGSPRDVRIVDDGGGLAFVLVGSVPERRLPLPVVHGWLTLRSGVPAGYVQSDTLLRSTEIAFNTFETFRGADAPRVFGRVLAVCRHVLGSRSFSVEPYQLGHGNEEGLASGAWWFYAKLGFRPKDPAVARLARSEMARARRDPGHRSDWATLERLASRHLSWEPDPAVPALLPRVPSLGLALRPAGLDDARGRLGLRTLSGWTAAERQALERLAPVLAALPGLPRWPAAERRRLAQAVRAKGAAREIAFARRLDAHARASRALASLLVRAGG